MKIPCDDYGCTKCCQPRSDTAGGLIGSSETNPVDTKITTLSNGRRVISHVMDPFHDGMLCSQLDVSGCKIYDERPFVCRTYPFVLRRGELVLSLTCPWVAKFLLPTWCDRGILNSEKNMLREKLSWMKDHIPDDIKAYWDNDVDEHYIVITVQLQEMNDE